MTSAGGGGYRQDGERYSDVCVVKRRQFGGGRVTVWGGITARDIGPFYR